MRTTSRLSFRSGSVFRTHLNVACRHVVDGPKLDINRTMTKSWSLVGGHSPMHFFRFALIAALQTRFTVPAIKPRNDPAKKEALSIIR